MLGPPAMPSCGLIWLPGPPGRPMKAPGWPGPPGFMGKGSPLLTGGPGGPRSPIAITSCC